MTRWGALLILLIVPGLAFAAPPPGDVSFRDITATSGVTFRHTFGDRDFSKILKATGSGVGILDYDGDGDLDLYFVNGSYLEEICDEAGKVNEGATNRLFRNDGRNAELGTITFTDVTEEAGVGDTGYGMGCAVADYDNDGDTDLYVTNYGRNVLYRNNGDGRFTVVTDTAGVAGPSSLNGFVKWSTNACWFDYDKDGQLDLYVCNYLAFDPAFNNFYGPEGFPGPSNYLGQPSILYRNKGDGTFEDVTVKAGLFRKEGRGMGASAGDLNNDGWPDLFEANDDMVNFLFINQGDGTFREAADETLVARGQGGENTAAMHGAMGDFDRDGRLDIFVPDMNYFSLFRNLASESWTRMVFEDTTMRSGIAAACGQYVGWGGFFFDYDNDGWQDIFVATGEAHRPENEPNLVLRNLGNGKFKDVSLSLGKRLFWERRLSRGAACADLDNDGDLDVVVVNIDVKAKGKEGLPSVLENIGGNARNWLTVKLIGARSNRDGIGAKIIVTAGRRTYVDEARSAVAYLSSVTPRVHFGLGDAEAVERVEVRWPSGEVQVLEDVSVNQLLIITEKVARKGGGR